MSCGCGTLGCLCARPDCVKGWVELGYRKDQVAAPDPETTWHRADQEAALPVLLAGGEYEGWHLQDVDISLGVRRCAVCARAAPRPPEVQLADQEELLAQEDEARQEAMFGPPPPRHPSLGAAGD